MIPITINSNTNNIGINNDSPTESLDVKGNIQIATSQLKPGKIIFYNHDNTAVKSEINGLSEDINKGELVFYTQSTNTGLTEKLRINANGKVGIGTTTPVTELEVNGDIKCNTLNYQSLNPDPDPTSFCTNTLFYHTRYNVSTRTLGEPIYSNLSMPQRIFGGGHIGRSTVIFSGQDGSESSRIMINAVSESSTNSPAFEFMALNAEWRITYADFKVDQLRGPTTYNISDDRLKHNERDISNGLEIIRQINPKFYQRTKNMLGENYNGDLSGQVWWYEAGVIAQELLKIPDLSYCVTGGDHINPDTGEKVIDTYSVKYNDIFVYALSAVKELDTIVQKQTQLISSLEARLLALESK